MCSGVEEESGSFACRVLTDSVPALEVALAKKTVLTDRIKNLFANGQKNAFFQVKDCPIPSHLLRSGKKRIA